MSFGGLFRRFCRTLSTAAFVRAARLLGIEVTAVGPLDGPGDRWYARLGPMQDWWHVVELRGPYPVRLWSYHDRQHLFQVVQFVDGSTVLAQVLSGVRWSEFG
jgi:hypothetical protein